MKAKLAFTAISQIPLFGSRAAAISCCSEVPTNALEAVPNAFVRRWRVIDLNAEIADGALDLCVAEQELDRPKIAGAPID
jgi:hypothetical protein